jgi:hypothetical protein
MTAAAEREALPPMLTWFAHGRPKDAWQIEAERRLTNGQERAWLPLPEFTAADDDALLCLVHSAIDEAARQGLTSGDSPL